jgi:hypothetical protein
VDAEELRGDRLLLRIASHHAVVHEDRQDRDLAADGRL